MKYRLSVLDKSPVRETSSREKSAFDRMLNALRFYALSDEPSGGDD